MTHTFFLQRGPAKVVIDDRQHGSRNEDILAWMLFKEENFKLVCDHYPDIFYFFPLYAIAGQHTTYVSQVRSISDGCYDSAYKYRFISIHPTYKAINRTFICFQVLERLGNEDCKKFNKRPCHVYRSSQLTDMMLLKLSQYDNFEDRDTAAQLVPDAWEWLKSCRNLWESTGRPEAKKGRRSTGGGYTE